MKNLSRYSICTLALYIIAPSALAQLRDPTQPNMFVSNNSPTKQSTELKLQSIIKNSTAFKAIISGHIYRVGDVVDDFRVLSINSKHVVLANDDKQIKLELYDYEIKK
ncbi:agglutinin biogenesis protein MshK [Pseudoalteromonas sp. B28]|jgi:MSHA biogenesis protein MshK|uniref:Agglutinin biogenesis protein MshK n=1 Tax=Pseudoalteromonas distincta TaxID=77608 RepID=A0A4P9IXK0_9GAMM|nr:MULTISPECIES: agglutinin biogenesis protein MshK [Pseudoalteromonas]KHM50164.1 agglutinin biogenesis protein MshK [Pseudoalteromonas elyakovii]KID40893.1 agglutinin biogenesis protein MshK [Pseudoalteromonas distincta]MBB1337246.1 agglutinin biogenesis protein MshK [Pseudoalteromonas sp. SR44-2]MBH0066741.1 agglutinin biogenesis protein MshK [Pseudoalteromonas sp. NZS100]MDC3212068.1 agglutinin biogenesis protein MshK [Pseudoalteromonas distincta]|tara:strand:+ start:36433 stop:36756 length:324 start_codon:yes stop_codon:yes gene_type:complete